MNDPTERDGKFKKTYATIYSHRQEFTIFWGREGSDLQNTMIQMTANANDHKKPLETEFLFKRMIAGGASYSYTVPNEAECGILKEKVPLSYHDVKGVIVKVKETTCRGLGCG